MSSYGDKFDIVGFENIVRDGYWETPADPIGSGIVATGTPQGATVMRAGDATLLDSKGMLGVATFPNPIGKSGCGVAVYEHLFDTGNYMNNRWNQAVPPNVRVVVVSGPGVIIRISRDFFTGGVITGLVVGDGVVPNGTGGWAVNPDPLVVPWGYVERIEGAPYDMVNIRLVG